MLSLRTDEEFRRNVRRISIARFISQAGSQAARIALIAVVYERTGGSGVWLAGVFFTSFAVRALLGPWVGAIGDHFDRRTVMVCSDLAAVPAFIGLAVVHSPYALLGLAVVAALAEAPFSPAANAQVLMLVPEEEQAWATASRATALWSGILIGGVIGGALVAAFGAPTTFLINAGTFLVSAGFSLRVSGGPYRAASSRHAAHRGVMAGVRLLWREQALRLSLASICLGFLGAGMMNVAEYPLLVHLGGGALAYGVGIAAWGIGGLAGGRSVGRARDAMGERRRLISGQLLLALGVLVAGLVPFVPAVVFLFAVAGFGNAAALAASSLIIRRWTPDPVRSRVSGAYDSVTSAALGAALGVAAVALPAFGASGVFVLGGIVTLVAVAVARRVPPRPQGNRQQPEVAPSSSERGVPPLALSSA